jgi:hypothetical protein
MQHSREHSWILHCRIEEILFLIKGQRNHPDQLSRKLKSLGEVFKVNLAKAREETLIRPLVYPV